jgi:hypothetical protein
MGFILRFRNTSIVLFLALSISLSVFPSHSHAKKPRRTILPPKGTPDHCLKRYQKMLVKISGLGTKAKEYMIELGTSDMGPIRLVLKDVKLESQVNRRALGFMKEIGPNEKPGIVGRILANAEKGANEKVLNVTAEDIKQYALKKGLPLPKSKIPKWQKRNAPFFSKWQSDVFGGIDYNINRPVRALTRQMVRAGLIKSEKELTIPMLMVLSTYAFYPLDKLREHNEETHRQSVKRTIQKDFRFMDLREDLRVMETAIKNAGTENLTEDKKLELWGNLEAKLDLLGNAMDSYQEIAADLDKEYNEAELITELINDPKQREAQKTEIDIKRTLTLITHPTFTDLREMAGIETIEQLQEPAAFAVAKAMVDARQRLYERYYLILTPGLNIKNIPKSYIPEWNKIYNSSYGRALKSAKDSKAISDEEYTSLLMEDSHWEMERFGLWDQFGGTPNFRQNGKDTGRPLTHKDIQKEIFDDIIEERKKTANSASIPNLLKAKSLIQ